MRSKTGFRNNTELQNNNVHKDRKKLSLKVILSRVIAGILALLLIAGILISIIPLANAADFSYNNDKVIRIGINYKNAEGNYLFSSMSFGFSYGFEIGTYNRSTNIFTSLASFPEKSIVISSGENGSINFVSSGGALLYRHEAQGSPICLKPLQSYEGENSLAVAQSGCKYGGILEFCRKGGENISIINILYLEDYIKGVLVSEVSPSWPEEALKAQAVITRSFVLNSLGGKHANDDFDVCNKTHCQAYSGQGKHDARTNKATDSTRGEVLIYNGAVAFTPYHSSSGGATESASGAWGGSPDKYPYLSGVSADFETCDEYPNGVWSANISETELTEYINSKPGYEGKLIGSIADITCDKDHSGYVNTLTVSDAYGNAITVKNSSSVRNFLSKYVKSAKFTITTLCSVPVNDAYYDVDTQNLLVMTANGLEKIKIFPSKLRVISSYGPQSLSNEEVIYTISGKGNGHGVGLSQYGAKTLAELGHNYQYILIVFYPGTVLDHWSSVLK